MAVDRGDGGSSPRRRRPVSRSRPPGHRSSPSPKPRGASRPPGHRQTPPPVRRPRRNAGASRPPGHRHSPAPKPRGATRPPGHRQTGPNPRPRPNIGARRPPGHRQGPAPKRRARPGANAARPPGHRRSAARLAYDKSVRAFQRKKGLKVDGIAGPKTRRAGWGKKSGGHNHGNKGHDHGNKAPKAKAPKRPNRGPAPKPKPQKKAPEYRAPKFRFTKAKDVARDAAAAVAADLNGQIGAIERQINIAKKNAERDSGRVTSRGQDAAKQLTGLYKNLDVAHSQLRTAQTQMFKGAKKSSKTQYDALTSQVGMTGTQAAKAARRELARLGLGEAAPTATYGISQDAAWMQDLARINGANAQTNLQQSEVDYGGMLNAQQAGNRSVGVNRQADNTINVNDLLARIQEGYSNTSTDLQGRIGDIEGTRNERIRQVMEAMQDKEYGRSMEQQQVNFEQELARNRFGLERASFSAQQAAQRSAARLERDAFEASMQPRPASQKEILDAAYRRAQIDALQKRTREREKAAKTPKQAPVYRPPIPFLPGYDPTRPPELMKPIVPPLLRAP